MVKYRNKVIVVEHKGRIIRRFRGIKKLQVHNIESRVTSNLLVVPLHQGGHSQDMVSLHRLSYKIDNSCICLHLITYQGL